MSIRGKYEEHGAEGFYQAQGHAYRNPHEPAVRAALVGAVDEWQLREGPVLDLACGSGEVTLTLRELGVGPVEGVDPYTGAAYLARTGQPALALSFEQIALGALAERRFAWVCCSYALHLVPDSWLPRVVFRLAEISERLLILTPHKRPELQDDWGYRPVGELRLERVRARCYQRAL